LKLETWRATGDRSSPPLSLAELVAYKAAALDRVVAQPGTQLPAKLAQMAFDCRICDLIFASAINCREYLITLQPAFAVVRQILKNASLAPWQLHGGSAYDGIATVREYADIAGDRLGALYRPPSDRRGPRQDFADMNRLLHYIVSAGSKELQGRLQLAVVDQGDNRRSGALLDSLGQSFAARSYANKKGLNRMHFSTRRGSQPQRKIIRDEAHGCDALSPKTRGISIQNAVTKINYQNQVTTSQNPRDITQKYA